MQQPNAPGEPELHLALLGGFEARSRSGELLHVRTVKAQALLAYLALESQVPHPRSKLAALLWGGVPDAQAKDSLRHALHDIRHAFRVAAPCAISISGDRVALDAM